MGSAEESSARGRAAFSCSKGCRNCADKPHRKCPVSLKSAWTAGNTTFQQCLEATRVHACVKTADPLRHCIETAVQVLVDKGCSRAEQAKMTYATSVDVAKAGTQCFRDGASLETAIRQHTQNMHLAGFDCFLGGVLCAISAVLSLKPQTLNPKPYTLHPKP